MIAASDLASLIGAALIAALGGEAFLKGVLGIAKSLRVPTLLVAATLAALATSSPELTVATMAALAGRPEIGLGDALGSNVVNIALIFGLALLFGPIRGARDELRRDFALAVVVPLLTLGFAFDGEISRAEGGLLLLIFAIWLLIAIRGGLASRRAALPADAAAEQPLRAVAYGVVGLIALVIAGRLFVNGATGIATGLGIEPYVIGATVVAIGTSLPELVTVLLARMRGHHDIGVGTLLGSNLFNGLAIVGVASSIHPIRAPLAEIAVSIGVGVVAVVIMYPNHAGIIPRVRGVALLLAYAVFLLATIMVARGA
jgi:cation:H+ antiporter